MISSVVILVSSVVIQVSSAFFWFSECFFRFSGFLHGFSGADVGRGWIFDLLGSHMGFPLCSYGYPTSLY